MGAAGFLPLMAGLEMAKHVTSTSNLSHATTLLLAVMGSVLILFGAVIICIFVSRENLLAFACAEAAGIIVMTVVFIVRRRLMQD